MQTVADIDLKQRGMIWVELVGFGPVRVCNHCGHAPASHVSRRRNGCQEDGCFCPYTFKALEAMDYVADEQEARAEADFWCENCEQAVDEPDTRYECGNCGAEFGYEDEGSNRCPGCGKFASKTSDNACPTCGEELEAGGR